jgi:CHASE2 domain-containing sensor protein
MDNYVVKRLNPNLRLIMSDEGVNGDLGTPGIGWRAYHASLVDALAGKAKVIVFDLNLIGSSPADEQLAAAIKRAEAQGTRVVLSKRVRDDGAVVADLPTTLQDAASTRWGNIDVVGQHWGFVRVYQLAQSPGAQTGAGQAQISVPSLALQAVTQYLDPNSGILHFDEGAERIQVGSGPAKSIPVYQTQPTVYDLPYDMVDYVQIHDASRSYRDVYARLHDADYLRFFHDKIVIVGFKTPDELFSIAHGQRRYGAEIHANVVSDILGDVYVRWLPASYDLLIVVILAAIGALVSARLPNTLTAKVPLPFTGRRLRIPGLLLLTVVIYLLIAFLSYKFGLVYILRTHHLVTPFVAYWLTGKMRRRIALKPSKGVAV